MVDSNQRNRRTILQATGTAISGAVLVTGSATAEERSKNRDDKGECGEVLINTEHEEIISFDRERGMDVFITDKIDRTVSHERYAQDVSATDIRNESIQPLNGHHDIIIDFQGFSNDLGTCGGYVYTSHYDGGIAMEFGSSIGDFSNSVASGAICAAIGALGGIAGAATGFIGCAFIKTFILPSIDTDGNQLSIGFWDCHGGLINQASLCVGAVDNMVDLTAGMDQLERYSGVHIQGLSVVGPLP